MKAFRLALALSSALLLVTCGGGASSDPVAVCNQVCQRFTSLCDPDAGAAGTMNCQTMQCRMVNQTTCTYSNMSAITTAVNVCLAKTTCRDLQTCLSTTIPAGVGCDAGFGG